MFDDFNDDNKGSAEERGRRGASALMSVVVFSLIALFVGGAMATQQLRARKKKQEMDVTFEALPKMKAPKPKVVAAPKKAKKAKPKKITQVTEIPDERPEEAEGELVEADDTGPIDGVVDGEEGGTAVPVEAPKPMVAEVEPEPVERRGEQVREMITRPKYLSGCRAPTIPEALHGQAETIRIEVRILVDADGSVKSAKVTESHPLVPDQVILECAQAQRFEPAHLPDGTTVPYPFRRRFVFKPAQA
jgi:hypothetical protein